MVSRPIKEVQNQGAGSGEAAPGRRVNRVQSAQADGGREGQTPIFYLNVCVVGGWVGIGSYSPEKAGRRGSVKTTFLLNTPPKQGPHRRFGSFELR